MLQLASFISNPSLLNISFDSNSQQLQILHSENNILKIFLRKFSSVGTQLQLCTTDQSFLILTRIKLYLIDFAQRNVYNFSYGAPSFKILFDSISFDTAGTTFTDAGILEGHFNRFVSSPHIGLLMSHFPLRGK